MINSQASWVFGANDTALGLGLNHLPYTAFLHEPSGERHLAVAIGACLLDLNQAAAALPLVTQDAVRAPYLNQLMALGPSVWADLRVALQTLLATTNKDRTLLEPALLAARDVELLLPGDTRNYTDFYASRDHARRVGELFRPDKPLLENYDWLPIAYHGRASSLVASGTPVRRPRGQRRGDPAPMFGPSEKLDYELELGFFIGQGNALGDSILIDQAEGHLFGVSLLNDWSARDIQAWEYQPLGPFLGKSFCTSVSPLITPMAALQPFRTAARPAHPQLAPYLVQHGQACNFKLQVQATLQPADGFPAMQLSTGDSSHLWWTPAQMIAHHTVNGCNLQPGDLLATGTISGPEHSSAGCLLELTRDGHQPLANGRMWLQDGDELILTASVIATGEMPIRLGECRGRIHPA